MLLTLANIHIKNHPLHEADGQRYNQTRNRLGEIAKERAKTRRRTQEQYRDRRRRRLSTKARSSRHVGTSPVIFPLKKFINSI